MRNARYTSVSSNNVAGIDNALLLQAVPSVFATQPWHEVSAAYKFIPTIEVVEMLRDSGFSLVWASQSHSRIEGKGDFTKHLLRFRHQDYIINPPSECSEIVVANAHDRTGAYKFINGIFRMVCGNGMIATSESFGSVSVRHSGSSDFHARVKDATLQVLENAPKALETVNAWKQISLPAPAQHAYATAVTELLDTPNIDTDRMLSSRRREDWKDADGNRSLWTTLNVVQEAVIKGGVSARSESGRRTKTRAVKAVDKNVKLNSALWKLTEAMAKLAG